MHDATPIHTLTRNLSAELAELSFPQSIAAVYNPLSYAWPIHADYLAKYGQGHKPIIFLGMNPGPHGMLQTGIPFGEIAAVRWLGVTGEISQPPVLHAKRPITGLATNKSEVSGKRLWGLIQEKFTTPENFFAQHFVVNFCPLAFFDEAGRNLTPDKFTKATKLALDAVCLKYLRLVLQQLACRTIIAVGRYAEQCAQQACLALPSAPKVIRILHPSPANPHANKGWSEQVRHTLAQHGLWQ